MKQTIPEIREKFKQLKSLKRRIEKAEEWFKLNFSKVDEPIYDKCLREYGKLLAEYNRIFNLPVQREMFNSIEKGILDE